MDYKKFTHEVKLTWKWVRGKFNEKFRGKPPVKRQELDRPAEEANVPPVDISIATIAIVLDGEVQEVIRAQDRMAALFLSGPEFIEVPEDLQVKPTIGWKYSDYKFVNPNELKIDESQIVEYIPDTTTE